MPATAEDNVVLLDEIRRVRELVDPSFRLLPKRFDKAAQEFMVSHASTLRSDPRTIRSNLKLLDDHFHDRLLHEITPADIQQMILARLKTGVCHATVNRQRAILSSLFRWSVEQGYAIVNPVKNVKKFRESAGRTRFLTKDETERLLKACKPHLRELVFAAIYTGGRLSELLKLRWSEVNCERGILTFRRETTKSGKGRTIPLAPELARMLHNLREARRHLTDYGWDPDHVFTYVGRPLACVRTAFIHARKKAGLEDVRFHDLRHSFASNFVMNGGDIYRLQRLLGHSSISLTERYSHLSEDFMQQAVSFIGIPGTVRAPLKLVKQAPPAPPPEVPPSDAHEATDVQEPKQTPKKGNAAALLEDLVAIFAMEHNPQIATALLVQRLTKMDRWAWIGDEPIEAGRQIGRILRDVGVRPRQIHWKGANEKGYRVEDIASAFVAHARD
ncbi:MAG TPA: site-specific integrase [Candidatus Dormibacteraeota bacterium]|nr:site-specific integrase [Candidatus Dormibacteraeota bacterium]